MTATLAPPLQLLQWPLVRTAAKVFRRGPAVTVRHWRKRSLRAAYQLGSAGAGLVQEEQTDPGLVEEGRVLRQRILETNRRKHAAAGYRVLMLRPGSITAEIWFGDLQRCMQHAGIDCHVLPPHTATDAINAAFEELQPNVFIATEATEDLRTLDLPFIFRYKKTRGCLRLLVPVWHANIPRAWVPGVHSTPQLDEWRRRLRWNGLTADAHFSIFEPEFHERFARDADGPAIDYVSIPQACNPFVDHPLAAARTHDYFMAASMTDDRVEVAHRFLRPVLARYRGLWAGPLWGFGTERIPPAEMPLRYAQSRIALSPLVAFVQEYAAELTHRVYAAAGCGAFQLTMPTAITGRYFRPDELVQAASPAEYLRLFDHYVHRPLERNAIARAALRRAYAEHTCFHRVDKLLHHLNDWRSRGLF
jgi:glycosyl transferase family 1